MKVALGFALAVGVVLGSAVAQAAPLAEKDVPAPLAPWVDWVLAGHEAERCPFLQGSGDRRQCTWPASLSLKLDEKGGTFTQEWRVFGEAWVALPGDEKRWPQDVRVDGNPAPAIFREGAARVRLVEGSHTITGSFGWDSLPEMLQVPAETGLLSLTVRGRGVDFPSRDEEGRLWLQRVQSAEEGESRLELIVHRRLIDDIPVQLVTNVTFKVSGKNREVLLGKAVPAGFVPMSLVGPLPARVEADGKLRVQVRPGTWTIVLTSRSAGPVESIALAADPGGAWDADEAWVFEARPALRVVSVEGPPSIDPQQTELPGDWRQFPAYLMKPGDTMKLVERRRGNADPAPDRLALDRTLWLDFDGGGFTVQDRVSGTLSRSWRLEMGKETVLGRAAIDGSDQFITSLSPGAPRGIEVRQGVFTLEADSRIEHGVSTVPAVGWSHDFDSVSGRLHLPPGWRLIHATGVDAASPTWLNRWDLLDLFLLLIIALSIGKLWGWRWGAVAVITLALVWHESGAPRWIWLALLVGEALVRVLPEGMFRSGVRGYRWIVYGLLVLITVPFLVTQVRHGMYPQLEDRWEGGWNLADLVTGSERNGNMSMPVVMANKIPGAPPPPAELAKDQDEGEYDRAEEAVSGLLRSDGAKFERKAIQQTQSNLYAPDPRSQVSTGPGVPSWTWHEVTLSWRGPVAATQRIRLLLVPPWLNFVLGLVRVALVSILALLAMGVPPGPLVRSVRRRFSGGVATAIAVGLVTLAVLAAPAIARAQTNPSPEMLEELRKRLLEKPDCSPDCAEASRLKLDVSGSTLRARFEVSTVADTAVPLPGGAQQWVPERVILDGSPARGMYRTPDGLLWIVLAPGAHQIVLEGALPDRETVQVPLPLKPHRVEASLSGWVLDGLRDDGLSDDNLQLTRVRGAGGGTSDALQQEALPPFVRVERSLFLGLSWQVTTRVVRLTPPGAAVLVSVPLLPGESVTTADVRVENGRASVSMSPQASEVSWSSVLGETAKIDLKAPDSVPWVEVWRLDASPIWHVEPAGIPTVHAPDSGTRVREWRPWPGESISLAISRPDGVAGQTLTIDSSSLTISPGLRATDATLTLGLRSSRGAQHPLTLPEGAELQTLTLDGLTQPVRQEGRIVTLPIAPGSHSVVLAWRQPTGISPSWRTPQVGLGSQSVNDELVVTMPADRWTLAVAGPRLGPAVLFWSLLAIYLLLSIGLGTIKATPLRWYHWFLLAVGLTQVPIVVAAIIAGWLIALGFRKDRPAKNPALFDLVQIGLPFFTLIALGCLFGSIAEGLLGLPEMQIEGNGSSGQWLRWYQDRAQNELPRAWVLSVPLMVYRFAMLAWAMWIAWSLLAWLKWGWIAYTTGGLWKTTPPSAKPAASPAPAPAPKP